MEPTPRARRLNRNAAIVGGAVAISSLLVMVFLLTSSPRSEEGEAQARERAVQEAPQEPGFLRRAPIPPPVEDPRIARASDPAEPPTYGMEPDPYRGGDPYAVQYPSAPESVPAPQPSPAEVAYQSAVGSALLPGTPGSPRAAVSVGTEPPPTAATPSRAVTRIGDRARLLQAEVYGPGGGYEIPAGTVIHAVLVSAVDSDAPGDVVALVAHDVYDRGMRAVLIPRATRLLGRPSGSTVQGQRRLSLVWDRLVMPDGRTVLLPELRGQEESGAAGVKAKVDSHTASVLRSAILLSLVGAGAQLSQPQQSATFGQAPSAGQVAAGSLGQQLGSVSAEMIRRGMDLRPTLTLRQGERIDVLLTADLALEPHR